MPGMAKSEESSQGTMVMAALLVLALLFTGVWIYVSAAPGENAMWLLPWFGAAALVIIVVGMLAYLRRGGRTGGT